MYKYCYIYVIYNILLFFKNSSQCQTNSRHVGFRNCKKNCQGWQLEYQEHQLHSVQSALVWYWYAMVAIILENGPLKKGHLIKP